MSRLLRTYLRVLDKHPWKTQAVSTGDKLNFLYFSDRHDVSLKILWYNHDNVHDNLFL